MLSSMLACWKYNGFDDHDFTMTKYSLILLCGVRTGNLKDGNYFRNAGSSGWVSA
jgi:hypothetical protein